MIQILKLSSGFVDWRVLIRHEHIYYYRNRLPHREDGCAIIDPPWYPVFYLNGILYHGKKGFRKQLNKRGIKDKIQPVSPSEKYFLLSNNKMRYKVIQIVKKNDWIYSCKEKENICYVRNKIKLWVGLQYLERSDKPNMLDYIHSPYNEILEFLK